MPGANVFRLMAIAGFDANLMLTGRTLDENKLIAGIAMHRTTAEERKQRAEFGSKVGARLRDWRIEKGISVSRMAELIGCSHSSINDYETKGKVPGGIKLAELCLAGFDLNYALTGMTIDQIRERLNRNAA